LFLRLQGYARDPLDSSPKLPLDEICSNAAIVRYLISISRDHTWSFGSWGIQDDVVLFPSLLRDGKVVLDGIVSPGARDGHRQQ
jgi:hypothetical protein